ncbi:vacuolar protein sorting 55 superfamily protein [Naegleria gruberi]|uniref:Vacuolar protein sorting 55 superfamily protein n=1 Tax=Naegleria gruberi TaxID=5762 RepID=D2W2V9_NAEGR|nr:vacuolar protein sorting 55 superfamily protein [Naegleria gruberi]EFC36584.1 vacuolar protein sorting 55 superfamily protein [Naegleria gruberi]|eukprot:XP_002669328.1 vacuolar protein sorting 55 superfamily protein [Naegleria gruberi strain NEG-M]
MVSFRIVFGLLVAVAAGVSIGVMLAIIGCAVTWGGVEHPENWFALITVLCYIIAPFPDIIARAFSSRFEKEDPEDATVWEHFGAFLTSFIATIGLGLLFVLAHTGIIQWETFAFEISGGIVIVATLFISFLVFTIAKRREDAENYTY